VKISPAVAERLGGVVVHGEGLASSEVEMTKKETAELFEGLPAGQGLRLGQERQAQAAAARVLLPNRKQM
jgi:hypothetical protein